MRGEELGMNKTCIILLGLIVWRSSIHAGEDIHSALGALSQSLESLSKEVKPVKKEPWVNKDCFNRTNREESTRFVMSIKIDRGCELIKDKWFSFAYAAELLVKKLDFEAEPTPYYSNQAVQVDRYIDGVIVENLRDIYDLRKLPMSRSYINNMVIQIIMLLFYKESLEPGSWNRDFDTRFEEKDKDLKNKWLDFMNAFREKMVEEGWPYLEKSGTSAKA